MEITAKKAHLLSNLIELHSKEKPLLVVPASHYFILLEAYSDAVNENEQLKKAQEKTTGESA